MPAGYAYSSSTWFHLLLRVHTLAWFGLFTNVFWVCSFLDINIWSLEYNDTLQPWICAPVAGTFLSIMSIYLKVLTFAWKDLPVVHHIQCAKHWLYFNGQALPLVYNIAHISVCYDLFSLVWQLLQISLLNVHLSMKAPHFQGYGSFLIQ